MNKSVAQLFFTPAGSEFKDQNLLRVNKHFENSKSEEMG